MVAFLIGFTPGVDLQAQNALHSEDTIFVFTLNFSIGVGEVKHFNKEELVGLATTITTII